jgi:hypothetical protein
MSDTKYIIEETSVFVIEGKNEVDALTKALTPEVRGRTRVAHQFVINEGDEEEPKK